MRSATLILAPLAALVACAGPPAETAPEAVQRRLGAMGTWLALEVQAPTRAEALAASERAVRAIEAVEKRLSTWTEDSELARLNRSPAGEPHALSAELFADLRRARELTRATGAAFDPGVGRLVEVWDLRGGGRRPARAEIDEALAAGGLLGLDLSAGHAVRPAGLILEEGAFGKGVGLDAACRELKATSAASASIDLGGQLVVYGTQPGLRFGLADPRQRERVVLELEVDRGSLATSGNSERGIVVDGAARSHILDPRTGEPVPDFGSLTVWAPDATTADALSTALYVLGPDEAFVWVGHHPEIEVVVLSADDRGRLRARATPGLRGRLHPRVDELDVHFATRP